MYRQIFSPSRQYLVVLILRISLAFAFLYAAILGATHPFEWINYFPSILRNHFPDQVLLNFYGLIELVIAGWLVWGNKIFIPSLSATILLFLGILVNLTQFNDFFRNISLLGTALALTILSYPRVIRESELE
jgi:uncharacterized membrane protein YphA (DoxX/SURF4 family)